jgi:N-acetylglucosamine-6-sulfatase
MGRPRRYTGTHTSDMMGRFTNTYIRQFARQGRPFFIWNSQVAPHGMYVDGRWVDPVPAVRHRTVYPYAVPPTLSNPAYGEADVSDKPKYVRNATTLTRSRATTLHRLRIRSLRSVDDQVKSMVDTLREVGRLRNTYIFFTSDNGHLLGEHRLRWKNFPYEESLRVPLLARGPGIPANVERNSMYSLVDLAPTFLDIARRPRALDGRSMLATLRGGAAGYGDYLIQAGYDGSNGWWWRGVRSKDFVYVRYFDPVDEGFEELYDMRKDPHQLQNLVQNHGVQDGVPNVARNPAYQDDLLRYRQRLSDLSSCAGAGCRTGAVASP